MNTLYVFLPCFNEENNIGHLIEEWINQKDKLSQNGYNLAIRPIDDKSTDKTREVILEEQYKHPEIIKIIEHSVNMNLCGGLNSAIQSYMNTSTNGDLMCLMDGDNTHNPAYVHDMICAMENTYDCVIASRYQRGADVIGLSLLRSIISQLARVYYSIALHVPNVRDYTCGYRIYNHESITRLVKTYGNTPIKEKTFACMMELLYKLYLTGSNFCEVGFVLRYDKKNGESKMRVLKTIGSSLMAPFRLKRN